MAKVTYKIFFDTIIETDDRKMMDVDVMSVDPDVRYMVKKYMDLDGKRSRNKMILKFNSQIYDSRTDAQIFRYDGFVDDKQVVTINFMEFAQ